PTPTSSTATTARVTSEPRFIELSFHSTYAYASDLLIRFTFSRRPANHLLQRGAPFVPPVVCRDASSTARRTLPFAAAATAAARAASKASERTASEAPAASEPTQSAQASAPAAAPASQVTRVAATAHPWATHAAAAQGEQEHDEDGDQDQRRQQRSGFGALPVVAQLAAIPFQRHAFLGGDALRARQHARGEAAGEIAVPKPRRHLGAEGARLETIRQRALEPIAGLEPELALVQREQAQEPVVLALLADPPFLEHSHLVLVGRFRGGGADGEDRELGAGLPLHLIEERLELGARVVVEHCGAVGDIA